ncbi:MAG: LPS export ABC transporter periplasmic protein LptC [Sphingomicrobium sp.]
MSEAALQERSTKRRWAVPGGAHDRLVNWTKIALPSAVGVLIAVLMLAPLDEREDVSFILDKKKVDSAPERMRVEAARYTGSDSKGQQFSIHAERAVQRSSDVPLVDIEGMAARLSLTNGPLTIAANRGRYDIDAQRIAIDGPVSVAGPDGYRLSTSNVLVDMKARHLESRGRVAGRMRLGSFEAGRLEADLGERTISLEGGVRLKIVQGAVR